MVPAPLSAGFQSLPPLPRIKLGPSGADSQVGGLVHALGPCGSLQRGWEFLLLPPQPPRVFLIRGLRFYFPELEPWVAPAVPPGFSMCECGAAGSASCRTTCPIGPTICHISGFRYVAHLAARLHPSYRSG